MSVYVVIVAGTGIKIPAEPDPIVGFVAARRIHAPDKATAADTAKAMILREWRTKQYREANLGSDPILAIEDVQKLSFFRAIFSQAPTSGYTFYSREDARR